MEHEDTDPLVPQTADENDRASAWEAVFNDDAIRAVRQKVAPETHPDFDGRHCVECGDALPKVRLENGRIRCVSCQEILERKDKQRR